MRKHVKGSVSWVGYLDWELERFHGDDNSILNGSSQNAYLIEEEKYIYYHNYSLREMINKAGMLKRQLYMEMHGDDRAS